MTRTVYLEPAWKQPLYTQALIGNPPQGYQFIAKETVLEKGFTIAAKTSFAYTMQDWLFNIAPLYLIKSYLERFKRSLREADLTYAIAHLVFRREPWVLDMGCEQPYLLLGHERHFKRFKGVLKSVLTSPYCKKIICWAEVAKKAFLSQIDCEALEGKIDVVHGTVPKKDFVKERQEDKIKLLFVNSANLNQSYHFEAKGGKEIMEAFLELTKRYGNLELIVRSGMSQEMINKCRRIGNIKIIDKPIPWNELEREWKSADIFVLPTHITPAMVFIDAMSYELPIVTTDVWANPEIVEDGKTGFLVPKSTVAQYSDGFVLHLNSPEYERVVRTIDPRMVQALVEKISILIENEELRREMGKAGRWQVEHGKFSIERRNKKLKKIFDEATA